MNSKRRTLAVALAGVMLLSSVATAGAVSSAAANTTENSLSVAVEQPGNAGATVTVTQNDSTVENASVTVVVTDNASYEGAGDYVTDENGTAELPAPEENVTVEVTAEKDNATGSTTVTLTASEEDGSFGSLVSSFVHEMLNAGNDGGPIGQVISDYVTSNNPGNADENRPDDAGKPDDVGAQNSSAQNGTDDGSQGPPEKAGNDDGDAEDDSDEESEKGNNGNGSAKGNGK